MTTSKKTSINKDKVPALFRRLRAEDVAGKVIVDYGCGRETMADCWQENRPTADYVRELQCIMPGWDVVRHGKLIVVS